MTDDIFDGMDIGDAKSITENSAPAVDELISTFQSGELTELTTPPKLQHQSPKDSLSGTPRKNENNNFKNENIYDSGQNTPVRNSTNSFPIKQEYNQNNYNQNNNNYSSQNNNNQVSNWAHGGWDSGIATQNQTGHNSVASRSIASAMPKQWGVSQNHNNNNGMSSYAQSEMSMQSRFSLPSIASTTHPLNNNNNDNQSELSWTGSQNNGPPSRSGSRYPPMLPSNFPPQLIKSVKKSQKTCKI